MLTATNSTMEEAGLEFLHKLQRPSLLDRSLGPQPLGGKEHVVQLIMSQRLEDKQHLFTSYGETSDIEIKTLLSPRSVTEYVKQ